MVKVPSERFKCGIIITPLTGFLVPVWSPILVPFWSVSGPEFPSFIGFCAPPEVILGPFLGGFRPFIWPSILHAFGLPLELEYGPLLELENRLLLESATGLATFQVIFGPLF
jgi:hypothetical protein